MADDRSDRGARDRQRTNLSENYEVAYWSMKWGATREQLGQADRELGSMSSAVAKRLGKEA